MACKTFKEAILRALEEMPNGGTATEIYKVVVDKGFLPLTKGNTPEATLQAQLGDFIRKGDSRVSRAKQDKVYHYCLTKNTEQLEMKLENIPTPPPRRKEKKAQDTYHERDLHKLLCTFLKAKMGLYARTIYHEASSKKEKNQQWIHPDIIGVRFNEQKDPVCQKLFKQVSRENAAEIYSFELKREINSDSELKMYFFQALSNSHWANYGYLVAFDISDNLLDELGRMSAAYGIGFILLNANVYESKILFHSTRQSLDFRAMTKLCKINKDFKEFLAQVEMILSASEDYVKNLKEGMDRLCDPVFASEDECLAYCKEKNIPLTKE